MIKAIIFDCFGVLVTDALKTIVDQLDDAKKRQEIVDTVYQSSRGHIDASESRARISKTLQISQEEFSRKMTSGEVKNVRLMKYIKTLRKTYKTAILSNIRAGGLKVRFSDSELSEHFDVAIGSGDIGFAKPEPKAYTVAADKLGVRLNECLIVDDREDYCQAAISLGMSSILYISFEQMKSELEDILDRSGK